MVQASDWQIQQVIEKQILGQSICVFNLESKAANCQKLITFHTLTKDNFSSLPKIMKIISTIIGLSNPLGALRGLVGTSVQITTEMTPVECIRPFSADELDGMDGKMSAVGFSVSFGYEKVTMSAPNIFSVTLSGATAGMMIPGWTKATGKWALLEKAA